MLCREQTRNTWDEVMVVAYKNALAVHADGPPDPWLLAPCVSALSSQSLCCHDLHIAEGKGNFNSSFHD